MAQRISDTVIHLAGPTSLFQDKDGSLHISIDDPELKQQVKLSPRPATRVHEQLSNLMNTSEVQQAINPTVSLSTPMGEVVFDPQQGHWFTASIVHNDVTASIIISRRKADRPMVVVFDRVLDGQGRLVEREVASRLLETIWRVMKAWLVENEPEQVHGARFFSRHEEHLRNLESYNERMEKFRARRWFKGQRPQWSGLVATSSLEVTESQLVIEEDYR